jgi:hypothetical protein
MNFCPKCGRQRTSSKRFCRGCGNDFGQSAADSGIPLAIDSVAEVQVAATRLEPIPAADPARARAPANPDPLASWLAEPSLADAATRPDDETADGWKAAPGPVDPAGPRRRSGGGRTAALIIVGILVALAAGGGVYAIVSRSHGNAAAQPPSRPSVTVSASTAAPTGQASTSPTAGASTSPSTSPSASAPPSPTQTGTVQVAPDVASNPAEPRVAAYLNRYFNAINTRNYSEYNSLLDAENQQSDSKSSFDSGFATTKDSDEVLTGITDTSGGSLTANVSFTSHQSPADSVDQSACNNWRVSLYLVLQGNGYVMTAAPADYKAAHADC